MLTPALVKCTPAAIIMDVVFPEGALAGPRTLADLAPQMEKPPPLIFISSRGDLSARLQAVRAGGVAYFTKPVDIAALIDQLDELTTSESPEPYRVLIVDDSPSLASFYAFTLQRAAMVTQTVTDPGRLLETLSEFNPELILMDMYMPDCTGAELAQVIRQQEAYVSVPIVFLSTETDMGKQLATMQLGGDDFLTKPIEPEHLVSAVAARVHRYRVLRSYMERDSLTGLLNHTKIKEQLEVEINRVKRQKHPLAFAMIDIDHFKSVNDTYGHPTGDRVIKSLSKLLHQRLRRTDVIGRYGGEEFAVIFGDTDGATAAKVVDDIRAAFAQVRQHAEGGEFSVTFSGGVAEFPRFGSAADISGAADRALYEAKHAGRNRVREAKG
jgi:diguanylate cyclase (GGDEF)-like protein